MPDTLEHPPTVTTFNPLSSFFTRYKTTITGVLVGLLVLGGFILMFENRGKEDGGNAIEFVDASDQVQGVGGAADTKTVVENVVVEISGAVINAGVYELEVGSRVGELLEKAGGLSNSADAVWVAQNLNLAAKLKDEDKVYIPKEGEIRSNNSSDIGTAGGSVAGVSTPKPASMGKVNVNTATAEQLDSLPSIGPAYAARIIEYRNSHGGFKTVEELTNVSGIGTKTLEKIRDLVTVN